MTPARKKTAIAAVLAASAGLLALGYAALSNGTDEAEIKSMLEQTGQRMRNREFSGAARMARAITLKYPRRAEAYGVWILSLAMDNRTDDLRDAIAVARRQVPEAAAQFGPDVEKLLADIRSHHVLKAEADRASAGGDMLLSAQLLSRAYEVAPINPMVGLDAAQMWIWLKRPEKAVPVFRRMLANAVDADLKAEADAFFAANEPALARTAASLTVTAWRALDAAGKDAGQLATVEKTFREAIELHPKHEGLAAYGIVPMRSPYLGLATTLAATQKDDDVSNILYEAADNGVPAPAGPPLGKAGRFLSLAVCGGAPANTMEVRYRQAGKDWSEKVCSLARGDGN